MAYPPSPPESQASKIGGWLPRDKTIIRKAVRELVQRAKDNPTDLVAPVQALWDLIQSNPTVYMLFTEMLNEVPLIYPYNEDPSGQAEITDVPTLINTINYQVQNPIIYNDSAQIGTPINAILDWPMGTKAGFAAFTRDDVNSCFEAILNYWGAFLQTQASVSSVTTADGGWLSTAAQNDPGSPGLKDFLNVYAVPDPTAPNYGFTSWDSFFIRQYKDIDTQRPIASPTDPTVIASVAECTPFAFQTNVQLQDKFWAKDQNYSLQQMLGDVTAAQQFVGGSVYQAFLSADNYHCWHAPVSGTYTTDPLPLAGTYYSEPLLWGFDRDVTDKLVPFPDKAVDARSQGYISCCAKRAVAYIMPDDASLGLIALVMIGMAEVSSIQFDGVKGTHFNKGDEIGRFHFGGSTHCLVFGPNVQVELAPNAVVLDPTHESIDQPIVPVRSQLAIVTPKTGRA